MTRFLTIWRGGAPFIHGRQMRCLSSRWPPLKKEFAGGKSMTGDELFTKQAIELSKMAVKHGNEPFGALLVKDGKVVCTNENQIYTKHDPTFHGEAGLIREFCAQTGINDLHEYTMYASCEPCFMCSGAMVWTKLGRLVYAASNIDLEHILGNEGCISSRQAFCASYAIPIFFSSFCTSADFSTRPMETTFSLTAMAGMDIAP